MNTAEKGSDNVFSDLGLENAEGMLVKAQLAQQISAIINDRGWTQNRAAEFLGISKSELSGLLRGRFRGISEAEMLGYVTKLER